MGLTRGWEKGAREIWIETEGLNFVILDHKWCYESVLQDSNTRRVSDANRPKLMEFEGKYFFLAKTFMR